MRPFDAQDVFDMHMLEDFAGKLTAFNMTNMQFQVFIVMWRVGQGETATASILEQDLDVLTRQKLHHAATNVDTLGIFLFVIGLAVKEGATLTTAKLVLVAVFILLVNPVSTHALASSALVQGLKPWRKSKD